MKTIQRLILPGFTTCALLAQTCLTSASSIIPLSPSDHMNASAGVFRGTVLSLACFRNDDGLIYTRASIRVNEPLLGKFPEVLRVVHRGGQVGNEEEYFGLSPRFDAGVEYLIFVSRGMDGQLHCTQGCASAIPLTRDSSASADAKKNGSTGQELLDAVRLLAKQRQHFGSDVTDQADSGDVISSATTGMLQGVNARFLQPDRGEPIPYLIDADSLPSGISLSQATNAVQQALNSWVAVTSLKFKFEGITSFGQGADKITTGDEKLRIQLHDDYNSINSMGILGIGGRVSTTSPSPSGWDLGGNVNGNEFRKSTYGYVVLEAGSPSLQNPLTFAEVLCHEIGHALNMAHSSEVTTGDPTLYNSIMYYQAHADGRGATLGAYDPPVIQQCYPFNTVPYTYNRVIDATTAPAIVDFAGINEVELRGYDLHQTNLTLATNDQSSLNGTFALTGAKIKYSPGGYFADSSRYDPETTGGYTYRDRIFARYSDGTNASPYSLVRVLSFRGEATATPDGLPDYWMINYFGHSSPQTGDLSRTTDDADGDGLNNLQEYRAGTDPKDATSTPRITVFTGDSLQFQAQAYELYELLGSTNLTTWNLVTPLFPTTSSVTIRTTLPQTNVLATVSNLPTTSPRMFYRVMKVP